MRQVRLLAGAAALGAAVLFSGASTARPATPPGWGTIKGQVVWGGGSAPERPKLKVDKDQGSCLKNGDLHSDDLVVDPKTKGVQWVFVWLIDAKNPNAKLPINPALARLKDKEVVIDQPCCMFEPHAVGIRKGQVLVGKNSADIPHNMNIASVGKNPSTNQLIPPGGKVVVPGWVGSTSPTMVSCNIHPWMKAVVRAYDHPYFAVTDAKGEFTIKDAPAGTYNLVVWHDKLGWVNGTKTGKPVEIKAGDTTTLDKIEAKEPK